MKRDAAVVVWPSGFCWGLGYQGQNTHFLETSVFFGLAARLNKQYFLGKLWFFSLGTPGLQTTTWPINHNGIPLIGRMGGFQISVLVLEQKSLRNGIIIGVQG